MGVVFNLTFFPECLRGFALSMNEEIPRGGKRTLDLLVTLLLVSHSNTITDEFVREAGRLTGILMRSPSSWPTSKTGNVKIGIVSPEITGAPLRMSKFHGRRLFPLCFFTANTPFSLSI
jgi:hypothetical protein